VRDLVLAALHVGLEAVAVGPAAHHHELAGIAVRLPDLEVDEAVEGVDELRAPPERGDQLVRTLGGDAQA
jgi:hypothetical protein